MTEKVTQLEAAVVSALPPGNHVFQLEAAVVSALPPGNHVFQLEAAVVIDTTPVPPSGVGGNRGGDLRRSGKGGNTALMELAGEDQVMLCTGHRRLGVSLRAQSYGYLQLASI